jgi:broad specificity phosphatase PhoE
MFLVRHGPTHAKSMVGWSDLPADLSDTAALERLHDHLPPNASVISSDLSRAVETANAIQGTRPRLPHHADLREIHFGDWELKSHTEVEEPEHLMAFWDEPGDLEAPNGESWNAFSARVDRAIDCLLAQTNGDLVIVCHFGVVVTQIQRALRLSAYEAFGHKVDNLSVTEIHTSPRWDAKLINHLP